MAVTLDEAGHREGTIKIDDLGRVTDELRHFRGASRGDDILAARRHGLDLGPLRIQRHDATAGDHEIRRLGAGAARDEADDGGGDDWGDEVGCLHDTVL